MKDPNAQESHRQQVAIHSKQTYSAYVTGWKKHAENVVQSAEPDLRGFLLLVAEALPELAIQSIWDYFKTQESIPIVELAAIEFPSLNRDMALGSIKWQAKETSQPLPDDAKDEQTEDPEWDQLFKKTT